MAKFKLTGNREYYDRGEQSHIELHQGMCTGDLIIGGTIKGDQYDRPYNISGINVIEVSHFSKLNVKNYTYISSIEVDDDCSVVFNNHFNFEQQKLDLNVTRNSQFINKHERGVNFQNLNLNSLNIGVKSDVIFKQDDYQYELKTADVIVQIPDVTKFCNQYKHMRDLNNQKVLISDQAIINDAFKINSGIKIDVIDKKTQSLVIEVKKIENDDVVDSGFFDHIELLPQEIAASGEVSLPTEYFS